MPTSPSPHTEVAVLPSLPLSPSLLHEVFSHPRPWSEEFDLQGSRTSSPGSAGSHAKGKGKQPIEDEDDKDGEDAQHRVGMGMHDAYPPMTDEAAETRRVEETLKRWELAERQRRKSARESAQYTSGPSLLSSVTRTATLVLSGRTSIGTSVGPGGTRTFKSHETVDVAREGYAVPLDDIDHTRSSGDVTLLSPSPTLFSRNTSLDAVTCTASYKDTSENPFVHPSERTRPPTPLLTPVTPTSMLPPSRTPSPSPFGDAHAQQAVQGDLVMRVSTETHTDASKQSAANRTPFVPPPRPLGLPSLPDDVPHATQLQPTSQPDLRPPPREDPEERQEVRWWHEWLCGCGEGPDRGGDNQAGRTNPFE